MLVYKSNIQREIKEEDFPVYQEKGFKEYGAPYFDKPEHAKLDEVDTSTKKPLEKMKIAELRELASQKGVENTDVLNKAELIAVIKGF